MPFVKDVLQVSGKRIQLGDGEWQESSLQVSHMAGQTWMSLSKAFYTCQTLIVHQLFIVNHILKEERCSNTFHYGRH